MPNEKSKFILQKSPDYREDGSLRKFTKHSPAIRANMGDNHPMVVEPYAICDSGVGRKKQIRTKTLPPLRAGRGCDRKDTVAIAIPVLTPDRPDKRQNGRRFKENGEPMFTLTAQDKHGVVLSDKGKDSSMPKTEDANGTYKGMRIRRLTPVECERLQAYPDGWTQFGVASIDPDPRKCADREVIAIVAKNGKHWVGSNWCNNPQKVCPRKPKDKGDYRLCKSVCKQNAHAEVDACKKAGKNAMGATLYLIGHDHYCEDCQNVMEDHGIKEIVIGEYPVVEISDSQRYKCLGNSVTTSVVAEVVRKMLETYPLKESYTIDDVRDAIKSYAKTHTIENILSLLSPFGVLKVGDLLPEQYESVIKTFRSK